MPANLPPQYYELEREFKKEQDPKERLRLAQELLAMMPKHKGTDKLQAELKAKISKLRQQLETPQKKHGARTVETHDHIDKEGAGQVIMIGPPNSGKSSILATLTHAHPLIGDYPFSTREPLTGMMNFETIQIQLIDTPSISGDFYEGYITNLIRAADLVLFVADISSPAIAEEVRAVREQLAAHRIHLAARSAPAPGDSRIVQKATLVVGHKAFEDDSVRGPEILKTHFPEQHILATSILDDDSMRCLRREIFQALGIIRVYTKRVGHEADFNDPIILPTGGTVKEAAMTLHKDFAHKLQFARVWGKGKFEGQRVSKSYQLSDEDIIEFHL